jgi:heterodisulfide reductase subunit C
VMYQCFVDSAKDNGRVYELGMMLKLFLKTNPFAALKLAPVGLGLFLHQRLPLKPSRIRDVGKLKAILNKAKALGGAK